MTLTYDEASHHSDAQCDGEREGLDASLFGRIDASCCNTREDVCHSERDPDSSQNTWTSPLNPEIRDGAAKSQRLLPTCFKDTKKDLGPSYLGVRFVQTGLRLQNFRYSPLSINIFGCQGSSHGSDDGAQDTRHAVQVVYPTGVLDLQFLLQDGLRRSRRARGRC